MKAVRWEDAKREIRELEPGWDSPDRVAERERSRAEMRAEQRGYQLAQLRKNAGLTQAQVAAMMGVTQARVSQIEHGKITEVDAIRSSPSRAGSPGRLTGNQMVSYCGCRGSRVQGTGRPDSAGAA